MKKIVFFIGSDRKKATYQAVREFEKNLKKYSNFDFEYVFLSKYHLEFCCGCKLCFDKGKEFCPLKDDRDILLKKIEDADGVIFATPNYAFQVSARMKNIIDRFAYIFHRPRFFGKSFTVIVSQGVFGGNTIRKYLESTGANFGFNVTKGSTVTTLEPITKNQQKKLELQIKKSAKRFYKSLISTTPLVPSIFRLIMFRMTRSSIQSSEVKLFDYHYYKKKGWFETDYYYPSTLGPIKRLVGYVFDIVGYHMGKHT